MFDSHEQVENAIEQCFPSKPKEIWSKGFLAYPRDGKRLFQNVESMFFKLILFLMIRSGVEERLMMGHPYTRYTGKIYTRARAIS